mgnify:CR=1 FL=1
MKTPILQMTGISAAYDNKTVLENINLTVFERDFLGVIGPNGGGKTTLIKVMLGLLNPTAGKVTFYQEGKEVPEISMGYLPQYNSSTRNSQSRSTSRAFGTEPAEITFPVVLACPA